MRVAILRSWFQRWLKPTAWWAVVWLSALFLCSAGAVNGLLLASGNLTTDVPATACPPVWQSALVPAVNGHLPALAGVAAGAAAWVVGAVQGSNEYGFADTATFHWDGSAWTHVPSPNGGQDVNELSAVTALAGANAWAVGDYYGLDGQGSSTLVEHWDGTAWQIVPSPNPAYVSGFSSLAAISAVSATDIWAVGAAKPQAATAPYQTLVEHWNGTAWQIVASPNAGTGSSRLYSVAAVGATDVWAVGEGGGQPLTLHWNGSAWSQVRPPPCRGRRPCAASPP